VSTEHGDWLELFSGEFDRDLFLPLLSGSMAFTLLPGDMLTVRPMNGGKAHLGDIVVFREGRKLVAHRLIFVFRISSFELLIQKGDANKTATVIRPSMIVGKVRTARRGEEVVFEATAENRDRGRRIARRALVRYMTNEAPYGFIMRMLGRNA
jgi:signal peptidase I